MNLRGGAQAISRVLKLKRPSQGQILFRRGMNSALVVMKESGGVEIRPFYHELLARLQSIPGHKVVILDSAYDFVRFAGRAKIDEDSVNFFIKVVLQRLCDDGDCTLIIPWHPSQAGSERDNMDGWSVAWHNAPRRRLALKAAKNSSDIYELTVSKHNHTPPGQSLKLQFHEGALLPVDAIPDDGKRAALRRCVVQEAICGAKAGVPFTLQRRIPKAVLDTITAASGVEANNKLVHDELDAAARDGQLRYVTGTGKMRAGYFPPDDDRALRWHGATTGDGGRRWLRPRDGQDAIHHKMHCTGVKTGLKTGGKPI